MRNPNGYGSIVKLSGTRRKPYAVRVTTSYKTKDGLKKQSQKYLGYYAERKDAMKALSDYNMGLVNIERKGATLKEIFDWWSKGHFQTVGEWSVEGYNTAFNHWSDLHPTPMEEIRHSQMQTILDGKELSHSGKSKMRGLIRQLFRFAMTNDVIIKDYTGELKIKGQEKSDLHKPFNDFEIKRLKESAADYADTVLILIYTGMRVNELLEMKKENVNIEKRWMQGGSKTAAGKDRIIPIHKDILSLVQGRMETDGEYLIEPKLNYHKYRHRFKKVMEDINADHLTHDCRHTFATMMARTEADKLSVKRILGHADRDITDKVYTSKDIRDLLAAVDCL